jgi:spermidine synthase
MAQPICPSEPKPRATPDGSSQVQMLPSPDMTELKTSAPPGERPRTISLAAISLIGASTLALEILLTRIFSVTMWYHFAFVAVSLALFGVAVSGVAVSVAPRYFSGDRALTQMAFAAFAAGCCVIVSFLTDLAIPFVPFDVPGQSDGLHLLPYWLFLAKFLVLALPFLCMGLVIALAFSHFPGQVHRVYFADLAGGGLGCLAVIPLLRTLSGPSAVIFISTFSFLAAGLFFYRSGRARWATGSLIAAIGVCVFVYGNELSGWVRVTRVKSYDPAVAQIEEPPTVYERWHPVSRVAVHPLEHSGAPWYWFYSPGRQMVFPRVMEVTNDGGARTYMYPRMESTQAEELFRGDASDLVYAMTNSPEVLVVGIGGGKDILAALALGANHVTGVELNPLMIEIVQETFADFTGAPLSDPRVTVVVGEGRNYVASHDRLYDVIKISVTDTWAASAAGAYAMTENYLYTIEALEDFMGSLTPGGYLSIVRWYPTESMRLAMMAVETLRLQGVDMPGERIVMARNDSVVNLVIKNDVFERGEVEHFRAAAHAAGLVFLGGGGLEPDVGEEVDDERSQQLVLDHLHWQIASGAQTEQLQRLIPFDLEPATDDRPFFFNPVTLDEVDEKAYYHLGGFAFQHGRAMALLVGLLKITLVVSLVFVLGPVLLRGIGPWADVGVPVTVSASLYFLMLGIGYLLVEIPLLQQFILFLGHPTYAAITVLFIMLVSSGLGSLLASRLFDPIGGRSILLFPALLVPLIGVAIFIRPILSATIGLDLWARILISVLVIGPVALLLGMPFPLGVRVLHGRVGVLVPWAWAINGVASVAAPVLAMILAIVWGFSTALLVGAACYAAAGPLLYLVRKFADVPVCEPAEAVSTADG